MAIETPNYPDHAGLTPLDSRMVDPERLPWTPTRFEGVDMKVLMEDKETGLMTALFRWAPGAVLPFHEHVEIEQTYMLEGRLEDEQGSIGPGEYAWRPAGSRHVARAPRRRGHAQHVPQTEPVPRRERLNAAWHDLQWDEELEVLRLTKLEFNRSTAHANWRQNAQEPSFPRIPDCVNYESKLILTLRFNRSFLKQHLY